MSTRQWAMIDLDGTLSDCTHRAAYAAVARRPGLTRAHRNAAWKAFHARCVDDPPHEAECELVRVWVAAGHGVVYVTGRTNDFRAETEAWLHRWEVPAGDHLMMRPPDSTALNTDYKRLVYEHIWSSAIIPFGQRVDFVMEDDDRLVEMWRAMGLTCLQPRRSSH